MNTLNRTIDNIITYLGKSNDSEIVTATLAAVKLLFIPIATMSDKKTSKEQKQYAIKRDFLTEGIALTGYIGITKAIKNNVTAPICAKYYKQNAKKIKNLTLEEKNILDSVDAKSIKNYAMNDLNPKKIKPLSDTQLKNIKTLEGIAKKFNLQNPKELYLNTKKTISHACVCTLALTFIPFITNKILEIISNFKDKKAKKLEKPTFTNNQINTFKPMNINQYMEKTRLGGIDVFRY